MESVVARNKFLTHTYLWMMLSLLVSGVSALFFSNTSFAYLFAGEGLRTAVVFLVILGIEFYMIYKIQDMAVNNPSLAKVLLLVFSAIGGATMSYIFIAYSPEIVGLAFLVAAVDFGSMSLIGAIMKKDSSHLRRQLCAMVFALIIVWIVEFFLQSTMVAMIFSGIGVLIFSALTLCDTNQLVRAANEYDDDSGLEIIGALDLYIDFINIFVDLLNIFSISNIRN